MDYHNRGQSFADAVTADPLGVTRRIHVAPNEEHRSGRAGVAFHNEHGTRAKWIKEGKGAIKWTRLWCRTFAADAVQLHAPAYNLCNFLRTLATPEPIKDWSLAMREKLIKIGAKVVSHGRYVAFQIAEVTISGECSKRFCA